MDHAGQHQSVFKTFLKPGVYVCYFESMKDVFSGDIDLEYCARVFYDKKS